MKHFYTVAILFLSLLAGKNSYAQTNRLDSLFATSDTTLVLDSIMNDFGAFLDSISQPKSFFTISAGIGTGFFSFKSDINDFNFERKNLYSPALTYYHKSGFGLSVAAYLINEGGNFDPYEYAVSPSYDYLNNSKFAAGVTFTRYFTKKNLSFYTTPVENEAYGYFNYRKWWLSPGIAFSYGWGSKSEFEKQEIQISSRWLKARRRFIFMQTDHSIRDFTTLLSLRHNFEWFKVAGSRDALTLTPAILLSAGTQNVGYNTSFSSNSRFVINSYLPVNTNISDTKAFEVQSASFVLRADYSFRNYFILPQLLVDYYLHPSDNRLNSVYSITVGCNF